jgi:hypothetical protein
MSSTTTAPSKEPTKKKAAVRYYRFRNGLKQKALAAAGSGDGGGPPTLPAEVLAAAEAEFEKMAEDYPDWVQNHIRKLYEQHGRCVDTPEARHQLFKNLNEIAHDMKGQGGTFGYDLISDFGSSLFDFTRPREDYIDNHVEIVKAHIDAMNAVIKGRVNGTGGEIGKELKASLAQAIEKYNSVD